MGRIGELFALPNHGAGLLVQRHHGTFLATGRYDDVVAINERRFGVAPTGQRAAEIFHKLLAPHFLAIRGAETNQVTPLAEGIEEITVERGSRARALELGIAYRTRFAELCSPNGGPV